ncbi:GatB/YqeY domain-containing protein [Patescibacteria group bacterium]|nr:GatB/YqeY domain-containing protein [Patescibacteria group bacterium]HOM78067.1 GatB/YqeY domain-containing protein [bacterium]
MVLTDLQKKVFEYAKAGDTVRVSVLRFLISALKNKEIDLRAKGETLSVEDALKVTQKQIKQRKEVIEISAKSGRNDIKEKEEQELVILEEILEFISSLAE